MARLTVRNPALKLVAIVVAALLWFLVSGQQEAQRTMRIPLEYANLPQDLELRGETPMVADVRVRGSAAALGRIAPGELVAVLDLRSARAGRRLFHLGVKDVRTPFGLDVVQVAPSNVSITVEPSATKALSVMPDLEGEPAAGFRVGKVSAQPDTVEVIGPASAVAGLTRVVTEPVSIAGASARVRETVNAGVADPSVRLKAPQRITVDVEIVPVSAASR